MAITATLTASPEGVMANQKFELTCTVSNSGASDVNVTSITPSITPYNSSVQSCAAAVGLPAFAPGQSVDVAASGSRAFRFKGVIYAPTDEDTGLMFAHYQAHVAVVTSDGSAVAETTAPIVTCIENIQAANSGKLWFNEFENSGRIAAL